MSDYISRDELLELYAPDPECDKCSVPFPVVRQNILDMPAADVAPVRHGRKQEPELIKVKRVTESAVIPQRQSIGAAGFDLCADIAEDVEIPPHGFSMIYSGIAFEIPHNYFGAIYARSGLATRQGLRPATCVSVIDSDYRGNVGLPMFNDSNSVRVIHPKERIAQIVFQKALMVDLVQVDSLSDSERGDNGFGSTGR